MKYLIASDLHGSSYYTEKMIEVFNREKCNKIILLGDLLYHGPRNDLPEGHNPKSALDLLNEYSDRILAVRGNCDAFVDEEVLDFDLIPDYLELEDEGKKLMFTHGHMIGPNNLPPVGSCHILFTGHTHIPMDMVIDGVRCINPGSTSIPKGGSKNSVGIYEKGIFTLVEL